MIKNLKYRLSETQFTKRVRNGGMALLLAITLLAITLLECPIHTVEILTAQRFNTLNRAFTHVNAVAEKEIKSYPVYITQGNKTVTVNFTNGTVADALALAGITTDKHDFVEPSLDTQITDTAYIDYTDIAYISSTETKEIDYSTKVVYSDKKNKGYSKLTKKGVKGEKQITYTKKLVNGVAVSKTVAETKVLTKPQDAVKVVGTHVEAVKSSSDVNTISVLSPEKTIKLDKNGNPVGYKKKMTVRATAYTYTGNNCATGVAPKPGYIAVNPKVIPYGTKMYIKSPNGSVIYGYAVAADTGGFIRRHPTGIDLFMTSEAACVNFGVRQMEIYILE